MKQDRYLTKSLNGGKRFEKKSATSKKLFWTTTDIIIEIHGLILLTILWLLVIFKYANLADVIPIHYNAAGEADKFGGKNTIFILPVVATILFIGLTVLNKFPHIFNYIREITNENAYFQYTCATRLLRYMKFNIVAIISWITLSTTGDANNLGGWFLPVAIGLIIIPLVYYGIKVLPKR